MTHDILLAWHSSFVLLFVLFTLPTAMAQYEDVIQALHKSVTTSQRHINVKCTTCAPGEWSTLWAHTRACARSRGCDSDRSVFCFAGLCGYCCCLPAMIVFRPLSLFSLAHLTLVCACGHACVCAWAWVCVRVCACVRACVAATAVMGKVVPGDCLGGDDVSAVLNGGDHTPQADGGGRRRSRGGAGAQV